MIAEQAGHGREARRVLSGASGASDAAAAVHGAPPAEVRLVGTRAEDERRWEALIRRDRTADGTFVYGVSSTGVFCRPSCPSRRPKRDRVSYFTSPAEAQQAGFRACRRCRPNEPRGLRRADDAIDRVARYLIEHADESMSLARLGRMAGVSPSHLQRRFKVVLGVSPRQFQAARRADRFRRELRRGLDVTGALYEAGYGSPSRVYEASPTGPGMSPATYRRGGAGAEIGFTVVRCELGWLLVAATPAGVCSVKLGDSAAALEEDLRQEFFAARLSRRQEVRADWLDAIVAALSGSPAAATLPLDVRGTAFQWRVWRALQAIPRGETRSYAEVARAIGHRSAARAVARACSANPVCVVVPCHRVVPKDGGSGGYRWGVDRKQRLLEQEAKAAQRARRTHRDAAHSK
ncbi:MAG: bifunctional DNA-binding transcriptional regulator/O6-methylguanine-DNA methyltransferase Ada [Acidobacteriota bacterium]